ncbi:MAG: hypothetical protein QXP01_06370 [Candidatus Hadarchaeum sp.]
MGLLYGHTLDYGWWFDDSQILKHATQYSPWEYFFVPKAWQDLIPYHLTPWLSLAYDLDLALFGFRPAGFYAHNLAMLWLAGVLMYVLARQWVSGWFALTGATLFLVSAPAAIAAHALMTRHYVEGLVAYLAALLLFLHALKLTGNKHYWAIASGIVFAVAASAKEVFLPLGFLPLFLPIGHWRDRFRLALPWVVVMALYVPWRIWMLENAVGGYQPVGVLIKQVDIRILLDQFSKIPVLLLGSYAAVGWTALLSAFSVYLLLRRNGLEAYALWIVLIPLILVFLLAIPLLPLALTAELSGDGGEYRFIVLWAAFALLLVIGIGRALSNFLISGLLLTPVLITTAMTGMRAVDALQPKKLEYSALSNAIVELGQDDVIVIDSGISGHFPLGILDLRLRLGGKGMPPKLAADESQLAKALADGAQRVWRYQAEAGTMVDITNTVKDILANWRGRIRSVELAVEIRFDAKAGEIHWSLGPYSEGQYFYLADQVRIGIPRQGAIRRKKFSFDKECFLIRYDAPAGWIAYTPRLCMPPLDSNGITLLSWQGRSDLAL